MAVVISLMFHLNTYVKYLLYVDRISMRCSLNYYIHTPFTIQSLVEQMK